jgi:hypothetical protein
VADTAQNVVKVPRKCASPGDYPHRCLLALVVMERMSMLDPARLFDPHCLLAADEARVVDVSVILRRVVGRCGIFVAQCAAKRSQQSAGVGWAATPEYAEKPRKRPNPAKPPLERPEPGTAPTDPPEPEVVPAPGPPEEEGPPKKAPEPQRGPTEAPEPEEDPIPPESRSRLTPYASASAGAAPHDAAQILTR